MSNDKKVTVDGVTAVAAVAHALSEVIAIYPITPSSGMAEFADEWSSQGRTNLWDLVPSITEMQSEAGASGALHGAISNGALATTFTSSQGLLLMIPDMYKIAGELTPTVFHIAARALAGGGTSIFGDHSDVMGTRATGFAMLFATNVQESQDMAYIAHISTLKSKVPFMNIMDGFRTSHEVQKIVELSRESMTKMFDYKLVEDYRSRAMDSERPDVRGTLHNSDVYFASRESVNKFYDATPNIVQETMDAFAKETGRSYKIYEYYGAADATNVIVVMGSANETIKETIDTLNANGAKYGLVSVRLFRPFSAKMFAKVFPATVKYITVLDRTKEPGSLGEPLYEDVRTALGEMLHNGETAFKNYPEILAGRYGLGGYEFLPSMVKAIFENASSKSVKNHFTIGINDDVTNTSLVYDKNFVIKPEGQHEALFFGLGSDGTVGANKNSIKIIGDATDNYCQGYFFYDSKKAGTVTTSHLRFGKKPIRSPYLVTGASFIACHKFAFLERVEMLDFLDEGGVFLLASPYNKDEVWANIPKEVASKIIAKKARFYVIDATKIAEENGMGSRINVIMQTAFFKISGILQEDEAISLIKKSIEKSYGKKGQNIIDQNIATIDKALAGVELVSYSNEITSSKTMVQFIPDSAPTFIKEVTGEIIAGRGEYIPVSKLPNNGIWPTATTKYDKRNIAEKIPVWNSETCISCGRCSMVCPHGVIRMKAYDNTYLANAPKTFKHKLMDKGPLEGKNFTIQVAPEDCTGCGACINTCPTKEKSLTFASQIDLRETEKTNWDFFLNIPEMDRKLVSDTLPLGVSLRQPLFEFSGACAGCGETPYIKMLTQLFGDRMIIANATGCSSVYGGNLPTHPYAMRCDGKGPAWGNSLFEDAAEYGLGMKLTTEKLSEFALSLLDKVGLDNDLVNAIKNNTQSNEDEIELMRENVAKLKTALTSKTDAKARELMSVADKLVKKSHWIIGGDGWAYDIGYGGLDHVLASGKNINILVMDTEVYSNTGGQSSKATPLGAMAKFASGGKTTIKKPLGLMQMMYGYVYVAQISLGANMAGAIKAMKEAEAYPGPSIVIAYSHCINQGINMMKGMDQGKAAVTSGMWPLYRYNPSLRDEGKNPFILDSAAATTPLEDYLYSEVRFKSLQKSKPEEAEKMLNQLKVTIERQRKELDYLAKREF